MNTENKKAYLLLADGTVLTGQSFGATGTKIGEVVFATSMTGYEETLTDPSYFGQIVIQTFPLVGNYGVNREDKESEKVWVNGYIVREACDFPSNFRSEQDIGSFLKQNGIIGICGLDTRHLTRKIREVGVMNGAVTTGEIDSVKDELLMKIRSYKIERAVESVTCLERKLHESKEHRCQVAFVDYGAKANIVRNLVKRGCDVTVFPAESTAEEILQSHPDGIMLSNGPGDPADNIGMIKELSKLTKSGVPVFGICLGHQLLALANGAKTEKLKYGHRGANQPVKDLKTGRTYISSQNHGYAVVGESLPAEVGEVSFINANDNTCEGVEYQSFPGFTVQFHPEACGGPHDTEFLFDRFIALMEEQKHA